MYFYLWRVQDFWGTMMGVANLLFSKLNENEINWTWDGHISTTNDNWRVNKRFWPNYKLSANDLQDIILLFHLHTGIVGH